MSTPQEPPVCRLCGHAGDFTPVDPVRQLFRCGDCRQLLQADGSAWLNPYRPPKRPKRKRPTPWWSKQRRAKR